MDLGAKGKSKALNAGIFVSHGEIVFNVDADTRLAPDALSIVVRAFAADPKLGAVSGSIQVDEVPGTDPWWWRIFNMCEIIEYLQAFRVGRRFQTYRNSMFTISGAFSAFRRDVLVRTHLYDNITVSEDTKLTFDIRSMQEGRWRIGCVEQAQAFVEPIHSLSRFMSQRLRWQRGELEVLSLYPEFYMKTPIGALGSFVGRILISDHTLAFPRLVWVFIIPFLYSLGYSLPLVAAALWLTYFMYVILEAAFMFSVNATLKETYGHSILRWWYLAFLMPLYRFATYWFRLAGMIYALTETAQWSTLNEWERVRAAATSILSSLKRRRGRAIGG
jgi:putative glycosyltransferase (exosortase G-associated)